MMHLLLRSLRTALLLLSGLSFATCIAQGSRGGCSITLLSDSSTLVQSWCLDPTVATVVPVLWSVQGTGVQVANLPAGVTASLSNDTLTISGTISTAGVNAMQINTNEGCSSPLFYMGMHPYVDPQFACSLDGEDVTLHWPGINATMQEGGEIILLCTSSDGFFDTRTLFLPCPDSLVWTGLPTNTDLTFGMTGTGDSYCFPGYYETTCNILATGVSEQVEDDLVWRAVSAGYLLQLSASVELHEVRIYDMLGALVAAQRVNARVTSIPIASLAPGAFLLRVVGADGRVSVQHFIKE